MANHDRESLVGNPQRRATNTIRGYLYQFWWTVNAWLCLKPEELLFVEGAEDIDVVGENEATASQVKDNPSRGTITLGNVDVMTSLVNYWDIRESNSARRIKYKFITTRRVGCESERTDPQPGLVIWNALKDPAYPGRFVEAGWIRDFLLGKQSLDRRIAKYLRDSDLELILVDLIASIEWLFDQPQLEDIQEIVVGKLIEMGQPRGLTPRDAWQLAEDLCMEVERLLLLNPQRH